MTSSRLSVLTIIAVTGFSVIHSSLLAVDSNPNEVYGEKYTENRNTAPSSTNNCFFGANCVITSHRLEGEGMISSPINLQISNPGSQGQQVPPESDNKLQTRTVDGNIVAAPPNGNPTIATAQCGPGEVATGGGIIVDEANNIINPHFQEIGTPGSNPNTWVVSYTNFGPNVMHIQAEVICAQLVSVP